MASVIVIGKKELFSFAERYASVKLHDYASLADGHVLCLLFNHVFPQHAIRPAPAQTHSPSQRMQLNWESLYRRLVRVAIPVALLDPVGVLEGRAEAGFSALVLFYFLFHLTKRMDFTAEFALDLPEALTRFLQSLDCIAALLIGEAVEWSDVPDVLGEQVRELPAFHNSPQSEREQEEEAVRLVRSLFHSPSVRGGSHGAHLGARGPLTVPRPLQPVRGEQQTPLTTLENSHDTAHNESEEEGGEGVDAEEVESQSASSRQPSQTDSTLSRDSFICDDVADPAPDASLSHKLREEKRALIRHAADLQHKLTAMQRAKQQLEAERDALLELEGEREQELVALREENEKLRAASAPHRSGLLQARRSERVSQNITLGSTAVDSLLDDVLDAETGDVIDVHERANMLHCLLVEHLHDKPAHREQGQRWLWSLLSAYHVLETRLVTAVDVMTEREQSQRQERVAGQPDRRREVRASGQSPREKHGPTSPSSSHAPTTPRTQPKSVDTASHTDSDAETLHRVIADCFDKLTKAHEREHNLTEALRRLQTSLQSAEARASNRESLWRSLCAVMHAAEQASFTLAASDSEQEVESLLRERDEAYTRIDTLTERLVSDGPLSSSTECPEPAPRSPCTALLSQIELLREENTALRRQWRKLVATVDETTEEASGDHGHPLVSPHKSEHVVEPRIAQQQCYEETEVRPYRCGREESPSFTSTTPSASRHRSGRLKEVSPYAKSLLKLLTEVSSPLSSTR